MCKSGVIYLNLSRRPPSSCGLTAVRIPYAQNHSKFISGIGSAKYKFSIVCDNVRVIPWRPFIELCLNIVYILNFYRVVRH